MFKAVWVTTQSLNGVLLGSRCVCKMLGSASAVEDVRMSRHRYGNAKLLRDEAQCYPWYYLQVVNRVAFKIRQLPQKGYAGRSGIDPYW